MGNPFQPGNGRNVKIAPFSAGAERIRLQNTGTSMKSLHSIHCEGEEFPLVESKPGLGFHPEQFGIVTEKLHTACLRGFVGTFAIRDGRLFLDSLEVLAKDARYPEINGVPPACRGGPLRPALYFGLGRLRYTGTLRFGNDRDRPFHVDLFGPSIWMPGSRAAALAPGSPAPTTMFSFPAQKRRCQVLEFHHQLDDVARGAELAVLPGAGDLPEHVFVEVALGVAVLHRHAVNHVHDLGEQRGRGDGEARVLHVVRVGGVVAAEHAEEGKDVVIHHLIHLRWRKVLEARPAAVFVGAALRVFAFGEDAAFELLELQARGFVFLQRVQIVEALEEQQVVICSMTSRGLEIPPVQKAFQRASILLRISPVSMGRGASARGNYGARKNDRANSEGALPIWSSGFSRSGFSRTA